MDTAGIIGLIVIHYLFIIGGILSVLGFVNPGSERKNDKRIDTINSDGEKKEYPKAA